MVALMRYTQKSEQRKRAVLSLSFLKVGNKWVSCMQVQYVFQVGQRMFKLFVLQRIASQPE